MAENEKDSNNDVFLENVEVITNKHIYDLLKKTHDQAIKTNGRVNEHDVCIEKMQKDIKSIAKSSIVFYIKKNKVLLGIILMLIAGGGGTAAYNLPLKKIAVELLKIIS